MNTAQFNEIQFNQSLIISIVKYLKMKVFNIQNLKIKLSNIQNLKIKLSN